MSAIEDYGCQRDGCQRDAAEIVETDEGHVLLCRRCHDAAERGEVLRLRDGRLLIAMELAEWMIVPERRGPR